MENKLASLIKARDVFEDFRQNLVTDQDKAGAIQAFEFCFELVWKTMQKILQDKGISKSTPKDVMREAAAAGLITDIKTWLMFVDIRNKTEEIYDEDVMKEVVEIFASFSHELDAFCRKIPPQKCTP